MFSLEGKKALVTGASGGIGAEVAKVLAGQGATVAISGTREGALAEVAGSMNGKGVPVVANLSDMAQADSLVKQAQEKLGGLDILVCNAGVTRDNLLMRMKDEEWDEVIAVNLSASFRLMRAAVKDMMKQRAGRIIAITSVVGHMGNPGQANYCASKAGITGMVKSIAAEVASRNVTVNCIAPGFIETAMTGKLNDEQKERIMKGIPQARMGTPNDVAGAVVYLASEAAAYVTGQTIHVNGGLYMA